MLKNNRIATQPLKNFLQKQGLVLLKGIGAFFLVLISMQIIGKTFLKIFPALDTPKRTFFIRFIQLLHRTLTILFAIFAPLVVFFYEESWILTSIW